MATLTSIAGKKLEREIHNNGDQFRWKKNMKIIYTCGKKMRNASGYQSESERQWKNRANRNTNIFSIKRVNRNLKEVSRFSGAKQRQGNVQKSVLQVQSCFFANCHGFIVVVFYRSRCLHLLLLWYFNTVFKVFLLYLQIRVFY